MVNVSASELSIEEAASLLHGKDFWRLNGVTRLGIPEGLKVSDGPNGARGEDFVGGESSACFPAGSCLAASFDTDLMELIGGGLAEECKSKSAKVLLGPTANIHRSPLGGRNFESYSEDPVLSGLMAAGYINGLQSAGIGSAMKHFVCNDLETDRRATSINVPEAALREIYLRPFQIACAKAKPWMLMTAYNKVNGRYCSEDKRLLVDVLREEWDMNDICVVSDWWGTYSLEEAVKAGLDLEMPNSFFRGDGKLIDAAKKDKELEAAAKRNAAHVLQVIESSGGRDLEPEQPEQAIDRQEHRDLIRRAAAESGVLLKNNGILPLQKDTPLLLTGSFAKDALAHGGGSASLFAHRKVTPYEGFTEQFDSISFAEGLPAFVQVPLPSEQVFSSTGGKGTCLVEFHNPDGKLVESRHLTTTYLTCLDRYPKSLEEGWSATMTFDLTPLTSGEHILWVAAPALAKMYLDDQHIAETSANPHRRDDFMQLASHKLASQKLVKMEAGRTYKVRIEYASTQDVFLATDWPLNGIKFGFFEAVDEASLIKSAVSQAEEAGTAVVFVGHPSDYETEGFDREHMDLVGGQNELLAALGRSSAKVIVVIHTGSAINMPWLDSVDAVIWAGYGGQELGHAVADIASGKVNPSGRLPFTFPLRVEDNPSHSNFPGQDYNVSYEEGLFVGYRHYTSRDIPTLFPFGFGLSYTNFQLSQLQISGKETFGRSSRLDIAVTVTNTGEAAGRHTVLIFVRVPQEQSEKRPLISLEAFAKTRLLAPGQSETVSAELTGAAFSSWEGGEDGNWLVGDGLYTVEVRDDASKVLLEEEVEIRSGWKWKGLDT